MDHLPWILLPQRLLPLPQLFLSAEPGQLRPRVPHGPSLSLQIRIWRRTRACAHHLNRAPATATRAATPTKKMSTVWLENRDRSYPAQRPSSCRVCVPGLCSWGSLPAWVSIPSSHPPPCTQLFLNINSVSLAGNAKVDFLCQKVSRAKTTASSMMQDQ